MVGELDSHGRHFLIVEAKSSNAQPTTASTKAAAPAPRPRSMPEILTERELQIASLVSGGYLNKQIAGLLKISEYTVSTHIRRIFSKLSIKRRSMLASMYASSSPLDREAANDVEKLARGAK